MKNTIPCTDCKGNCSRCGHCCTIAIPITREEEKAIRDYIEKNNIEPENLIDGNDFYAYCCFYDRENRRCKIYDVRPGICRSFKCNKNPIVLEKEKFENHQKAYWNHMDEEGNIKNFTTFDLLFYKNPIPLLTLIFKTNNDKITPEKFEETKEKMKSWGLEELANSLTPVYEDENN